MNHNLLLSVRQYYFPSRKREKEKREKIVGKQNVTIFVLSFKIMQERSRIKIDNFHRIKLISANWEMSVESYYSNQTWVTHI